MRGTPHLLQAALAETEAEISALFRVQVHVFREDRISDRVGGQTEGQTREEVRQVAQQTNSKRDARVSVFIAVDRFRSACIGRDGRGRMRAANSDERRPSRAKPTNHDAIAEALAMNERFAGNLFSAQTNNSRSGAGREGQGADGPGASSAPLRQ